MLTTVSQTPLNMIKGPRAFNSGRPLPNDSFLYTFDEDGNYTVISQGAPGFSCTVNVMEVGGFLFLSCILNISRISLGLLFCA